MPCLTLWPSEECGLKGTCTETLENVTFCKCDSGWSQSLELNYFVDERELSSSICNYNRSVVDSAWVLVVIFAVLTNLLHIIKVKSWKHLKKRSWWLGFSFLLIIYATFRVSSPENAIIGVDLAPTLIFGFAVSLSMVAQYIFLDKYFTYISQKMSSAMIVTYFSRAKLAKKGFLYVTCASSISWQLLWIVTLPAIKRVDKLVIVRFNFGLCAIWCTYSLIFVRICLSELISDMNNLVELNQDNNQDSYTKISESGDNLICYVKRQIPKLKALRFHMTYLWSFQSISLSLFTFWSFALLTFSYLAPFLLCGLYLFSLTISISKLRGRGRGSAGKASSKYLQNSTDTQQTSQIEITRSEI